MEKMNRIRPINRLISQRNLDAVLITDPSQLFYLIHFTGTSGVLLILTDSIYFLTDKRYMDRCANEIMKDIHVEIYQDNRMDTLISIFNKLAIKKLAILENFITYSLIDNLQKSLPVLKIFPMEQALIPFIVRKTKKEIIELTDSLKIVEQGMEQTIAKLNEIETENEFSQKLQVQILMKGADENAFPPIIAWERNSAYPHYKTGNEMIRGQGKLLIDAGAIYHGFCSDITRMVYLGEPDEFFKKVYEMVRSAKNYAIEAIKPGVKIVDVVKIVCEYFSRQGMIKNYLHALGHGIGRTVHEFPRLSNNDDIYFEEGYVVTVEPGLYLEGWGGIRIEDTISVEKEQAIRLNTLNDHYFLLDVKRD
jgi:Xaa-Pro aminopeptidase